LFSVLYGSLVSGATLQRRQAVDVNNPEGSDPQISPASLPKPARPPNPFAKGFTPTPPECTNFLKPSEECINALKRQEGGVVAFPGGNLKWTDKDCTPEQRAKLETAAWDALTLGNFGAYASPPKSAKDIAAFETYMGPSYAEYAKRIAGRFLFPKLGLTYVLVANESRASLTDNFERVKDLKTNKKFDVIMNCNNEKKICGLKIDGKLVGGVRLDQQRLV
jgi:hypothetical protein